MGVFADISAALDAQTVLLSLPTAWQNKTFKPATDTLYIRPTLLPAGTEPTGFSDASDEHVGVYQVDIIAPIGGGKGEAMAIVDQIAAHFKRGTRLIRNSTKVTVQSVERTSGAMDGVYFVIGVVINYRSYTSQQ